MTRSPSLASSLLLALMWVGCGPRLIPGTEIQDTPDTREMLLVVERFRVALENKDAKTLATLTSPQFHDESGTPDPEDDLDATQLEEQLTRRFSKLQEVRVELDVRKIDVEKDVAKLIYYYTVSFRPTTLGGRAQRDSDLKLMTLERIDKEWKITSGI